MLHRKSSCNKVSMQIFCVCKESLLGYKHKHRRLTDYYYDYDYDYDYNHNQVGTVIQCVLYDSF